MAAVTSAIIGGVGAALSTYEVIDGAKRAKRAQRELNDYERQTIDNAFQDMPISTEGIDLQRDEANRTAASLVDSAQNSGSRAIIGAAPKISAGINDVNAGIYQYLDSLNNQRNYAIAGDNARIEGIKENRDNNNIAALSSQVQAGRQDMWSGIMGLGSSIGYAGRNATPGMNTPQQTVLEQNPVPEQYLTPTYNTTPTPLLNFFNTGY